MRNTGISPPGKGLLLPFLLVPLLSAAWILSAAFAGREVLGERHHMCPLGLHGSGDCVAATNPSLSYCSWPLLTEGKASLCFDSPSLTPLLLLPWPSTFHLLLPLTPPSLHPCSHIGGSGSFWSRGYRNYPRFCSVCVFSQGGLEKRISTCSCVRTRDGDSGPAAGMNTGCVL